MAKWNEDIFDNLVRLKRGHDLPDRNIYTGNFPVVASTSIKAYHNSYKAEPPCVVTGRSGSLGEVQYINTKCWPLNTTLYAKDFRGNYPKYVYFFLKTMHLENYNCGAGVPTLNQNHLHKLKIKIPPLPIQRKIAAILSAYDALIDNNNRRIAILEKMAGEIYREWFVRMRFPGHESIKVVKGVPEGWEVVELVDIAREVSKGTKPSEHLSDRFYLPMDLFGQQKFLPNGKEDYSQARSSLVLFEKGDILFGAMRPYLHKVIIAPFKGITRTTSFVIRPKETSYYSYLFLLLFQKSTVEYANLISNGSDRPYVVWNKGLERMKVYKPELYLIKLFNEKVFPLLTLIQEKYFLLENLKQSRDMLLSRLISGKLDVEKLEITFPPGMSITDSAEEKGVEAA